MNKPIINQKEAITRLKEGAPISDYDIRFNE